MNPLVEWHVSPKCSMTGGVSDVPGARQRETACETRSFRAGIALNRAIPGRSVPRDESWRTEVILSEEADASAHRHAGAPHGDGRHPPEPRGDPVRRIPVRLQGLRTVHHRAPPREP